MTHEPYRFTTGTNEGYTQVKVFASLDEMVQHLGRDRVFKIAQSAYITHQRNEARKARKMHIEGKG